MLTPDFSKSLDGLIPAIVQDFNTNTVLMLGYMNAAALAKTQQEGKVTFFSRTKNRLWTKGETTNHFLLVKTMALDCDNDTLLIKAIPQGATCHTSASLQTEKTILQKALTLPSCSLAASIKWHKKSAKKPLSSL
jgi:phosphoribosyl-AMP cyclohydrolase / phosphoribosyl-ATP pyrophosphohydrolase